MIHSKGLLLRQSVAQKLFPVPKQVQSGSVVVSCFYPLCTFSPLISLNKHIYIIVCVFTSKMLLLLILRLFITRTARGQTIEYQYITPSLMYQINYYSCTSPMAMAAVYSSTSQHRHSPSGQTVKEGNSAKGQCTVMLVITHLQSCFDL